MTKFTDPDELDAMIADLAREKRLPDGIHPDLVGPDLDNHRYWGWGNEERHEESCEWRLKLIAELHRRPKWVKEWRALQELDRRIEALCKERGLYFKPWETPPWAAPDELPEDYRPEPNSFEVLRPAVKLRKRLIAELEGRG
jgi:hypothetical protein